ncbi:MAG: hypothetical protein QXM86_02710 [Candidatus Bathyarchaeia archaeon]
MTRYSDIRVWGDKEDKEELYKRLERDNSICIRRILAEAMDPPLIVSVVFGLINVLKIIHDFLKEKKDKHIEVMISYPDGRTFNITSVNPDKLQVLIQELAKSKENSTMKS